MLKRVKTGSLAENCTRSGRRSDLAQLWGPFEAIVLPLTEKQLVNGPLLAVGQSVPGQAHRRQRVRSIPLFRCFGSVACRLAKRSNSLYSVVSSHCPRDRQGGIRLPSRELQLGQGMSVKLDALKRYDLNLLCILHVLLEECSVSKAAVRLHVSQSAISRSLARLRTVFNDELFIRQPHGLRPTRRALEIQAELGGVLEQIFQIVIPEPFDPATSTQRFRVSMMEHLSIQVVPCLLARLKAEAPNVTLGIYPWSKQSLQAMATERLDMCVNIVPPTSTDLHSRVIGSVDVCVLMAKTHPLAKAGRLSRAAYLAFPHVALTIAEYTENPFAEQINLLLKDRRVVLETSDPHTAFEVVRHSEALMIGTLSLCGTLIQRYNLTFMALPPEMQQLQASYHQTWHTVSHRQPAHIWFRTIVFDEIRRLLVSDAHLQAV